MKLPLRAILLLVLLLISAGLRFQGLDWDSRIGAHPDERYVVDVASRLRFPDRLDPLVVAPEYAYGHLPLYVLAFAHLCVPKVDPLLVGRAVAASFDLCTVFLTWSLGRQIYEERVGLLAAGVIGLSLAHVQQAHFYTPDSILVFFVLAALLFAVRYAQHGRNVDLWFAGGAAGLAAGTKATGVLLAIPLGMACLWHRWELGPIARLVLATVLAFVVADPFALLNLRSFAGSLAVQGSILRGSLDVPYTRQYHGTIPYLYPVVQQLRWGVGWVAGGGMLVGAVCHGLRILKEDPRPGPWILVAWVIPTFAFLGGLYTKFPRYMLPLLPVVAILGTAGAVNATKSLRGGFRAVCVVILGTLLARSVAFSAMYRVAHPWVEASWWMTEHVQPGAAIAVEAWDHPLPIDAGDYEVVELPVFDDETPEKWQRIEQVLTEVDYLVVASRRGYGSLARWPSRYGPTTRYYASLFSGELGFSPLACFGRYPRIGSLILKDNPAAELPFELPEMCESSFSRVWRQGRLDESFVVYDHPTAILFKADP